MQDAQLFYYKYFNISDMRLKSISLSKLHQLELVSFVESVLNILEKHDLSALHIKDASDILVQHYPQVLKLARAYGRCLVAKELKEVHINRVEYAAFIFTHVLYLEKLKKKSLTQETHIAGLVVRLHLKGIRKHNRSGVNGKLSNFFNAVDNDSKTNDAFQALGLLNYVEDLRELDNRFEELFDLRSKVMMETSKRSENKGIQTKAEEILRVLFAQLKQAQQTYPEQKDEYAPLFAQLNRIIPKYTKLIRTRATLNKKRAAAKAKAKSKLEAKTESTALIVIVDGKQTGLVTLNGRKEEKLGEKVEKKKVAPTNKKAKPKSKKPIATTQKKDTELKKKTNRGKNNNVEEDPNPKIRSDDAS